MLCGYLLKPNWVCAIGCDAAYGNPELEMGETCPYDDMEKCPCFFQAGSLIGII